MTFKGVQIENMIKGLDDDEIEFLDLVDRTKLAADRKKSIEDELELNDYRNRVATLQEKSLDQKLQAEIGIVKPKSVSSTRFSQTKLLQGIVVKKNEPKKRKPSNSDNKIDEENSKNVKKLSTVENCEMNGVGDQCTIMERKSATTDNADGNTDDSTSDDIVSKNIGLTCIGILPGLGWYSKSSSDEGSSDSDDCRPKKAKLDMLGRTIVIKEKEA